MPSTLSNTIRRVFAIAAATALTGACAPQTEATSESVAAIQADRAHPPRVIFDTDMDFDDASALAYLAQAHKLGQITLQAVTVANDGAGFPGSAIHNARCILHRAGLDDIPVADGSPSGTHDFPLDIRFGVAFVLGTALADCDASTDPSEISAAELMARELEGHPADITLITTGPLTNVRAAMEILRSRDRDHARFVEPLQRAFVMGGAVHVPGNLCCGLTPTFNNTQELNIWADPAAAQTVFGSLTPMTVHLVPLDATQHVPITTEFVARLQADATTPEAQTVRAIVGNPLFAPAIAAGQLFWWDPLTAVEAVHGNVVTFERDRIDVALDGESSGQLQSSSDGAALRVGTNADTQSFEQIFLDTLNGRR
jgi:inosine-uridine nucleoside N-ribohydrolase